MTNTISLFDTIIALKQQTQTSTQNLTILENASLIKSYVDLYLTLQNNHRIQPRDTAFQSFPFNAMQSLRQLLAHTKSSRIVTITNPLLSLNRQKRFFAPGFMVDIIQDYMEAVIDPALARIEHRLNILEQQIAQFNSAPRISYGYSNSRTKRGFWKDFLEFTDEEDVNRIVKNSLLTNNELFETNFKAFEKAILEQERSLLKNNNALSQIYEETCKLAKTSNDQFKQKSCCVAKTLLK